MKNLPALIRQTVIFFSLATYLSFAGHTLADPPQLQWTNTDLEVLAMLSSEGLEGGEQISAEGESLGALIPGGNLGAVYPVATDQPRADLFLDGGGDVYRFQGHSECAGIVEISWVDSSGAAAPVLDAQIRAAADDGSGRFLVQAVASVGEATSHERLVVRGGSYLHLEVAFSLGADLQGRAALFSRVFEVHVGCDQIIAREIELARDIDLQGAADVIDQDQGSELPNRPNGRDLLGIVTLDRAEATGPRPNATQAATKSAEQPAGPVVSKNLQGAGTTQFCQVDDFADGDFSDWSQAFIGDADHGGASEVGGRLHLSGNGTTLFHGPDNTFFLYRSVGGDFRAELDVTDVPVDQGGGFRKAGLMARTGTGDLDPRVMVQYLPLNPFFLVSTLLFDYRDENGVAQALGSQLLDVTLSLRLAIDRRGDLFTVYYSTDGGATWQVPAGGAGGSVEIPMGPSVLVGANVASYSTDTMTVEFDDFRLCRPNQEPAPVPLPPVACQAGRRLELLYMLDSSGSMTTPFPGAPSKLDAARLAMVHLDDLIEDLLPGSKAGLVTYRGAISDPPFNLASSFQTLSALTTDFDALEAAAAAIDISQIHPDTTTPVAIAFDRLLGYVQAEHDPAFLPVVLHFTDGVPNIDFEGRGPLQYRFSEINPLSLHDGASAFLPFGQVAWLGNYNGGINTYDGEVLADAMFRIQQLKDAIPDLLIESIEVKGDEVVKEDLLEFAAFYSGGRFLKVEDTASLLDGLTQLAEAYDCGATIGDRVWNDADGDGVQDAGENGLVDVELRLVDSDGQTVATTTTVADGEYLFDHVPAGTFTVLVVPSTLPAGLEEPTFDLDGTATPHRASVTVVDGDIRLEVDFGYQEQSICELAVLKTCQLPAGDFACKKPIDGLTMTWNGTETVRVKAWNGDVGSELLADIDPVAPGAMVDIGDLSESPNDIIWQIFATGTESKLGESKFHLSCSDDDMDGPEDCGKAAGDGKNNDADLLNDWLLEGMVDAVGSFVCSPGPSTLDSCEFEATAADCNTVGKPETLSFLYTGGGCAASDHGQPAASCHGTVAAGLPAIIAHADQTFTVAPGEVVTLQKDRNEMAIELSNAGGTEHNVLHISCSRPLAAGDVYGSLTLMALDGQGLGSPVTYGYQITNVGAVPSTDIEAVDDHLGLVGTVATLAPGETVSFEASAFITETTINTVTVTGQSGAQCGATDSATVTVTTPPPCTVEVQKMSLKNKHIEWQLKNTNEHQLTISRIEASWPSAHGELKKVKLGNKTIFDTKISSPAVLESFEGGDKDRRIDNNKKKKLKLEFEHSAAGSTEQYSVTVTFAEGCTLELDATSSGGECTKPVDELSMIWNGNAVVQVKAWKGDVGSELLADVHGIAPAQELTVSGLGGSPNDVYWQVFDEGTSQEIGRSRFHLSCSDQDMNSADDCGKAAGNGKNNDAVLLNDWLFEGLVDAVGGFDCSEL